MLDRLWPLVIRPLLGKSAPVDASELEMDLVFPLKWEQFRWNTLYSRGRGSRKMPRLHTLDAPHHSFAKADLAKAFVNPVPRIPP